MKITAQMVKKLRDETGAAFLDCKKALETHDGDIEKAIEYVRKKGLAAAEKKADRIATEGIIEAYSHTAGRVGVMVEVNCETDFVARTPQFEEFAHNLALHIAFHAPSYVQIEDIPNVIAEAKQKRLRDRALEEGKPENIVDKIVQGRLGKWHEEIVLLEQPWIREEEKAVKEVLTELIAELKENIVVRRFARYEVGETIEQEEA